MSKIIAFIGATGAQGLWGIKHLLAPGPDGSPSPWKVRALTRDPSHSRAKQIEALGAEIVQGSFLDAATIHKLFDGVYGAFVNTDGFTVGEAAELLAAFHIWEIARYRKLRHFVWSNLDYSLRLGDYDPIYACDHYNAKGRFADFLAAQPNPIDKKDGTVWTVFTNGPYMDMLKEFLSPSHVREDGTRVWVVPLGDTGMVPFIALEDLGWWIRYIFDNAESTTGKVLEVASQQVTYHEIVETFKRVTGLPAEYKAVSMDEFLTVWNGDKIPVASDVPQGRRWNESFSGFFAMWRDNIVKRDMEWIKSIHEPITLEKWMRDNKYDGITRIGGVMKVLEDGTMALQRNFDVTNKL